MKLAKIRFLGKEERAVLPKGGGLLPQALQRRVIEKAKPYRLTAERDVLTGILQTTTENAMTQGWRKNAEKLLEQLKKEGIEIIIPPTEGELPRGILPFATGKRLTTLFAFAGAAEALKRQGKYPAECTYLLSGGTLEEWRTALLSMGNEVNHLAIFTINPDSAKELAQELLEERGLLPEVFSSPKNPVFSQADVVLGCGMEQWAYEYMLQEGAVWIDLEGNRPVLRRLQVARPDVFACDGFFFKQEGRQMEGRLAEAEAFLSCSVFRENWRFSLAEAAGKEMLAELQEKGYTVSGFSAGGNRIKMHRKS